MPRNGPAPRTLYVHRPLLNGDELRRWAAGIGLPSTLTADDMHATVCYSRKPLAWQGVPPLTEPVTVSGGARTLKMLGKALVLKFSSPALRQRWRAFQDAGASHDWPDFQPHVTLTYRAPAGFDLAKAEAFSGPLRFGGERYAETGGGGRPDPEEVPTKRRLLLVKRAA